MDVPFLQFVEKAKMQILVVNVGCSIATFQKYQQQLVATQQVALSDVPPPASKETTCTLVMALN